MTNPVDSNLNDPAPFEDSETGFVGKALESLCVSKNGLSIAEKNGKNPGSETGSHFIAVTGIGKQFHRWLSVLRTEEVLGNDRREALEKSAVESGMEDGFLHELGLVEQAALSVVELTFPESTISHPLPLNLCMAAKKNIGKEELVTRIVSTTNAFQNIVSRFSEAFVSRETISNYRRNTFPDDQFGVDSMKSNSRSLENSSYSGGKRTEKIQGDPVLHRGTGILQKEINNFIVERIERTWDAREVFHESFSTESLSNLVEYSKGFSNSLENPIRISEKNRSILDNFKFPDVRMNLKKEISGLTGEATLQGTPDQSGIIPSVMKSEMHRNTLGMERDSHYSIVEFKRTETIKFKNIIEKLQKGQVPRGNFWKKEYNQNKQGGAKHSIYSFVQEAIEMQVPTLAKMGEKRKQAVHGETSSYIPERKLAYNRPEPFFPILEWSKESPGLNRTAFEQDLTEQNLRLEALRPNYLSRPASYPTQKIQNHIQTENYFSAMDWAGKDKLSNINEFESGNLVRAVNQNHFAEPAGDSSFSISLPEIQSFPAIPSTGKSGFANFTIDIKNMVGTMNLPSGKTVRGKIDDMGRQMSMAFYDELKKLGEVVL